MIVKERPPMIGPTEHERFDETSLDGRLTEPNDGVLYHVREIAFKMKQLGRQLTDEELEEFVIRQ